MKKFISILLSLCIVLSMLTFTVSAADEITVYVNGERVYFTQAPILENGTTLVPMRAILEKMETTVNWADNTRTIHCVRDDTIVDLKVGSDVVMVNNTTLRRLQTVPKIVGGSTMVPLRFISESFGANVSWNQESRVINITIDPAKNPPPPKFDNMVVPTAVSASKCYQSTTAENAVDNDLATRWAADCGEENHWIEADLGSQKDIFGIGLAWYMGGGRKYYFSVSVSSDGENFTDLIPAGESSGKSEDIENYNFAETKARYVRITGKGNVKNTYAHLTEMRLFGPEGVPVTEVTNSAAAEEETLVAAPTSEAYAVENVTASSKEGRNNAQNVIDGDNSTMWSVDCEKGEEWIQLDLGNTRLIDQIGILWYKGNEYRYTFSIETSSDGETFKKTVDRMTNSGKRADMEYFFAGSDRARYVRITVHKGEPISANVQPVNMCHISEIKLY